MSGLTVAEVLERAADLIEPEGKWVKGDFARNINGDSLENGYDDGAVCFCALGAIEHIVGEGECTTPYKWVVADVVGRSTTAFNDALGRTQAEVVEALRKAATLAREQSK